MMLQRSAPRTLLSAAILQSLKQLLRADESFNCLHMLALSVKNNSCGVTSHAKSGHQLLVFLSVEFKRNKLLITRLATPAFDQESRSILRQ